MNNTQKRISAIIGGIVLVVLAIVCMLIEFLIPKMAGIESLNENNTIEYNATVQSVKKTKNGYLIELVEYDVGLKVEKDLLTENYDLSSVISEGDSIDFRIFGIPIDLTQESGFTEVICSLKHEGDEIIPLSRANDRYKKSNIIMKITVTGFSVVLVSLAVFICVWTFKKTKKPDKKEQSDTFDVSASECSKGTQN